MHTLTCEWCGKVFQAVKATSHGKPRRFCGTSCSARWRMTQPEIRARVLESIDRERSRDRMNALRARPDVREKLKAHLEGPGNPFRLPETRRKAQLALAQKGWNYLNGGNGTPMPVPQRLLLARLGPGWQAEFIVRTGQRGPLPTHFKIDIADPVLKVAVEVDGNSHQSSTGIARDLRKDAFLKSEGWTVIRVKNEEVMGDLEACAKRVIAACLSTTSKLAQETTSRTES